MKTKVIFATIFMMSVISATLIWQDIANGQAVKEGLVSYWAFDERDIEDNSIKDVWGKNNGTIVGEPQIVEGKVREALRFNGNGDSLNLGDDPSLRIGRPLTIEFWVKVLRDTLDDNLIAFTDGSVTNYIITSYQNAGKLSFIREDAGDANSQLNSPTAIDKNWHHVMAVDDGNTFYLYLDGNLDCSSGFSFTPYTAAGNLYVAQSPEGWATNGYFKGVIDEVRVYNRALTEDEVNQNMNAEGLAVNPADKLPLSWGKIKVERTALSVIKMEKYKK